MNRRAALLLVYLVVATFAGVSRCAADDDGWLPRPWKKGSPTRRALANTRDVLTPWDNDDKQNEFLEGHRRFFRPDLVAAEKRNQPIWYRPGTWFRDEPEVRQPATVSDWIGLERPGFGSP
jgi:hypothetical protein